MKAFLNWVSPKSLRMIIQGCPSVYHRKRKLIYIWYSHSYINQLLVSLVFHIIYMLKSHLPLVSEIKQALHFCNFCTWVFSYDDTFPKQPCYWTHPASLGANSLCCCRSPPGSPSSWVELLLCWAPWMRDVVQATASSLHWPFINSHNTIAAA